MTELYVWLGIKMFLTNSKRQDFVYVPGEYQSTLQKNKALFETWNKMKKWGIILWNNKIYVCKPNVNTYIDTI